MKTIKLLNGEEFEVKDILAKMDDDSFYYGYLGKNALSSSMCKSLIESPEAYVKELNKPAKAKEPQPFRDGRLIHLLALEPHRIEELTIIDSTKGSKAYKLAVEEKPSQSVYTRENIKYHVALISKKLRIEKTSDYVLTYYYDYKIKFHETNKFYFFCIEVDDLQKDFNDNDYEFILHYVNKNKN